MAWLSGITGKAESFLNSLDQKAAQALKENEALQAQQSAALSAGSPNTIQTSYTDVNKGQSILSVQTQSKKTLGHASHTLPSRLSETGDGLPESANLSAKGKSEQPKKKVDTDEALFEFLNSPEPAERRKSTPVNSTRHSRQSSSSSVVSNKGGRVPDPTSSSTSGSSMVHVEMPDNIIEESPSTTNLNTSIAEVNTSADGVNTSVSEVNSSNDSRGSPSEMDMAALEDAMQDQSPSNSDHGNPEVESHETQMTSSSLDLENRLLKNEVASLNHEMTSLVQRAKDAETELVKMRERLNNQSRESGKADRMIRELQGRDQDLNEALSAKDSQLAILRVRLEEADRELQSKQNTIEELESQKHRILQDHSDSSGIHGQALDSLRQKLIEVESALKREQEANKMSQQEASDRQARMEEEQRSFTEALSSSEKKLTEEKAKVTEISNQLKAVKSNMESAKQELSEYKEKATRILQSKERLIASLREGGGASGESMGVSSLEYDTVKQERDMCREEIQQSRMTIENLRVELADIESQMQQENDAAQETIRSLEDNVLEEKQRREDAEQELLKQKKELQYAIEELSKQKTSFQSRINDRDTEIDRLRNQLATKSMSSTTESELESRVRDLTESLIQKQTMVEALSTEKNSLGLQLERLHQQYKDVQSSAVRTNTTVIPVHDDDEVRHRLPLFMREGPTDMEVTRKMKRAANVIDRFSIRLGVFLRRYPIARIFVIIYMALLHLWVMIVLLTYQPEMHGVDIKMPAPPDN